ncbi:class I SAM-dependent methyltransferase [Glycomyces sp. L485]|uniref:class I SAM-dependent methyltransferase n=1 Tax=Glycomyces sp. L485 TaxID=2909235 RepID=UPI001F4AC2B5|nr:class I SAM-dependent methyltransferase [Glycomyces sp. L485]MCH7229445.1 class I SAM-dependent methyltransferase [Glycomyces sp. L485]
MARVKTLDDLRRRWDKEADHYDRSMTWAERRFFDDTRDWIAGRAQGRTLEVAIGTGLNLEHYPEGVELTGIDLSPRMLDGAKRRASELGRDADLRTGDAQRLDFPDGSFDTVVCTFSLCAVPDDRRAVAEMVRVLRPGGLLLLADHVVAGPRWIRAVQALIEIGSIRIGGEYFRRRPIRHVLAAGLSIEAHDRFKAGLIERLAARRPGRE